VKKKLEAEHYLITSSWLNEKTNDPTKITTYDLLPESNQLLAAKDFWEIEESDLVVIDTIDVSDRGGREVEMGYALAKKIQVVLVGPRRNVFHYLVREVYKDWDEFFNNWV